MRLLAQDSLRHPASAGAEQNFAGVNDQRDGDEPVLTAPGAR